MLLAWDSSWQLAVDFLTSQKPLDGDAAPRAHLEHQAAAKLLPETARADNLPACLRKDWFFYFLAKLRSPCVLSNLTLLCWILKGILPSDGLLNVVPVAKQPLSQLPKCCWFCRCHCSLSLIKSRSWMFLDVPTDLAFRLCLIFLHWHICKTLHTVRIFQLFYTVALV